MKRIERRTLKRVSEQLAGREWDGEALDELVAPAHGVIIGFQELLDELADLSRVDLGDTRPAGLPHSPKS
ncbi:MAG: hypothetical protein GY791_07525 [Alphaproteobacteria bacterium]|nr:hypothetical protein [Alphaproteobacteria bacterium]